MSQKHMTRLSPIILSAEAVDDALCATRKAGAEEICGLFVPQGTTGDYDFIQMANQSADRTQKFEISADDFAPYQDRDDVIIVHSHPQGPAYPSYEDLSLARRMGLVGALIVPLADEGADSYEIVLYGRACLASLSHRIYRHGVTDCFGFARDYLAHHHQIIVPDMPREWGWWQDGQDLYRDHFKDYGFVMLDEEAALQKGDVFIARLRAPVDNHGGVYCGQGLIKHHLASRHPVDRARLVTTEPLSRLQPYISFWLRHNTLFGGQEAPTGDQL